MKLSLALLAFAVTAFSSQDHAQAQQSQRSGTRAAQPARRSVRVSLSQVARFVKSQNLTVQTNAQKVYQAKQSISVARANLLPKLNIWRIATAPLSLTGALGIVEDVAPFLIPGNWFAARAQREFYQAEVEGYRSLLANELLTAKSTYLHLYYDKSLLRDIEQTKAEVKHSLDFVRRQEELGTVAQGTSSEIEIRYLTLEEDARSVRSLVREETALLASLLGYGATTELEIDPVDIVSPSSQRQVRYEEFESEMITFSPEVRQFSFLVRASTQVRRETRFSLFGLSTLSNGVAGGIFDGAPRQDGLGFGAGASVNVSRSQTRTLELQLMGTAETLKRTLRAAVDAYNLDVENYPGTVRRVELTEDMQKQIERRLELGELVPVRDIIESSRNRIQAISSRSEVRARFMINREKLNRLVLKYDYDDTSSAVPIARD